MRIKLLDFDLVKSDDFCSFAVKYLQREENSNSFIQRSIIKQWSAQEAVRGINELATIMVNV